MRAEITVINQKINESKKKSNGWKIVEIKI